jgi:hypothetical protein
VEQDERHSGVQEQQQLRHRREEPDFVQGVSVEQVRQQGDVKESLPVRSATQRTQIKASDTKNGEQQAEFRIEQYEAVIRKRLQPWRPADTRDISGK